MRIGIDVRLWGQTGVGTYIRNLVTNLSEIDKKNEYVLFARSFDKKDVEDNVPKSWVIVSADIPWHGISEQLKFPKLLNKFNLDLVHFPYFSVPIFYRRPYVITVHDLIVNRFNTGRASTLPLPFYVVKRLGYQTVLGNAIGQAKKIIVPTGTVGRDLMREYPFADKSKIQVTYEGGFDKELNPPAGGSKLKKIDGKYLLRVGNYYPHKNVEGLITGFKLFLNQRSAKVEQPKLILVGKKDYFYERMEKLVQSLGISSNILFLDNIDDSELVSLYKNAAATIVPSFAEGFSLTCVEAMSLGSPVLVSDIPVHREVCEDAAIYFDPKDLKNIAERIGFALDLIDSSRKELVEQGKKQAKKFSWRKMAEETLKIYESAI